MPLSGNSPTTERRALVIAPEAPYPMHGGGPLRTVSLIEYLRKRYTVDLIVFRTQDAVPIPEETFADVLQISLSCHSKDLAARVARNVGRLLRQTPPLVDRFSGFEAPMSQWLAGKTYDVALLEHFWVAPYAPLIRRHARKVVLDLHNVESELMGLPFRSTLRRMEAQLLPAADAVLVTSRDDAKKIPVPAIVYPNAIPDRPPPPRREHLAVAMSGNFEFFPNLLGVRWFARNVWPALKRRFPGLEWRLIGKNPHAVSRWITGDSQIIATGPVDDAVAEIACCRAAVVPIWHGSGTRLKILEAWAASTPIVSTLKGCEGLGTQNGEDLAVAENAREFVTAISRVLNDRAFGERLCLAGKKRLNDEFVWSRAAQRLQNSGAL